MGNASTPNLEPALDARTPLPGGLIGKQNWGHTYAVTGRETGPNFPSLRAVAFQITGTKWTGYLHLGLTRGTANGRK